MRETLMMPRGSSKTDNRFSTLVYGSRETKENDLLGNDIKGQATRFNIIQQKPVGHLTDNPVANQSRLEARIDDSFSQNGGDKSLEDYKNNKFKTNSLHDEKRSLLSQSLDKDRDSSQDTLQDNRRFKVGPEHLKSQVSGSLRRSNSSDQISPSQTTSRRSNVLQISAEFNRASAPLIEDDKNDPYAPTK